MLAIVCDCVTEEMAYKMNINTMNRGATVERHISTVPQYCWYSPMISVSPSLAARESEELSRATLR